MKYFLTSSSIFFYYLKQSQSVAFDEKMTPNRGSVPEQQHVRFKRLNQLRIENLLWYYGTVSPLVSNTSIQHDLFNDLYSIQSFS